MKLNKQLAALKKQTGIKAGAPRPTSPSSTPFPFRRWAILVFCLLLAFGGTWAFCVFVLWNRVPSELVGKWAVTEAPFEYKEATFQFFRSGYMEGRVDVGGDNIHIIKSTIRVQGKNIIVTSKHPKTGEEDVQVQIIRKLTDNELEVEDAKGKSMKMKRAK